MHARSIAPADARTAGRAEEGIAAPIYYLSDDAFVCRAQGYWVVLDAAADKYYCLSTTDIDSLSPWLAGTSGTDGTLSHIAPPPRLLTDLLDRGLLTSSSADGKPFAPCAHPVPRTSLAESVDPLPRKANWRSAPAAAIALRDANRILERDKLVAALRDLRARRRKLRECTGVDPVTMKDLLHTFEVVRPFYPRPYLCLFDSLALIGYLAKQGQFPWLVFGVIAEPFQAHCWVQDGDMVINDTLDRVFPYTPILAV